MDEATKALIEGLIASNTLLGEKVDNMVKLSESVADADATKVDALETADKLVKSELTEAGRKRVLESVKSGATIEDAIKTESTLRDEILAEAKVVVTEGRVYGDRSTATSAVDLGKVFG